MKPGQGADQLGFVRWILVVGHWGFQWHSGRVLSRESRHSLSTRRVSLQGQRGVRRQNLEQKRKPWPEPARDVCAHGADRIERYRLVQCAASRGIVQPGWICRVGSDPYLGLRLRPRGSPQQGGDYRLRTPGVRPDGIAHELHYSFPPGGFPMQAKCIGTAASCAPSSTTLFPPAECITEYFTINGGRSPCISAEIADEMTVRVCGGCADRR